MTQPQTDVPAPFWEVVGVFDPEGSAPSFGYTVGLHRHGMPELHLWAQPSLGEDPGADWTFSIRDVQTLLNDFVYRLLAGDLAAGSQVSRTFDGGAATATFTVGDPVDPATVDAFQTEDGARVLPLRWELRRDPEGTLAPVREDRMPGLLEYTGRIRAGLPDGASIPEKWAEATREVQAADFDVAGRFGPTTPLVLSYAAALAAADARTLADFLEDAMLAEQSTGPRAVLALTAAAARTAGRRTQLAEAQATAAAVCEDIAGVASPTRRWCDVVEVLGGTMSAEERDSFSAALRHLLDHAVAALLSTAVVHDVADHDLLRAGYGPFSWAIETDAAPVEWQAAAETLAAVTALLADLDADAVRRLSRRQAAAEDNDSYLGAYHRLRGLVLTAGGGAPEMLPLLPTPVAAAVADLADEDRSDLMIALDTIVAATHHRTTLAAADLSELRAVYVPTLPGLDALLTT